MPALRSKTGIFSVMKRNKKPLRTAGVKDITDGDEKPASGMAGHRHPCGLRFHETGIHDFGSTGKLFFVAEDPGSEGGNVFIGNLIVCVEYNNVAFTCDYGEFEVFTVNITA